jgi:hypothetical protein
VVFVAIAAKACVISRGVTAPEPSATLGTTGKSERMPSCFAVAMTFWMPTACASCTATLLSEWAKAVRNVTGPK